MRRLSFLIVSICLVLFSCHEGRDVPPSEKPVIVEIPEEMNDVVSSKIQSAISFATNNEGKVNDSLSVKFPELSLAFYSSDKYKPVWSDNETKNVLSDSLISFINQSMYFGLFPDNYYRNRLNAISERLSRDSLAIRDANMWMRFELLCTDAFFHLLKDLKEGRMVADSLSIVHKKNYIDSFFVQNLNAALGRHDITPVMESAEPTYFKYMDLRNSLRDFVDQMDTTRYQHIRFPFSDSLSFVKSVYARMLQEGIGDKETEIPDSMTFAKDISRFQKKHGLKADGKIGKLTVEMMNRNDMDKFLRAAITLDKFKKLQNFPETYVLVNIPAFSLQVWDHDSLLLTSKVIVGKPTTPTPELVSQINNLVIYPNWTIPESIIRKDILPELKKDPGYLKKKGYNLYTQKGDMVDPYTVNWSKYKTNIPWKVVQGSGDDNALGVFKFNFSNPYSVYLHDTNQRYLFANSDRALSHGCVRVQQWRQLADIIASRDSSLYTGGMLNYSKDSINTWVANGTRKSIMVKNRFPLYILYLTCDTKDGKIHFYDDIYGVDQRLAGTYFKNEI